MDKLTGGCGFIGSHFTGNIDYLPLIIYQGKVNQKRYQ